MLAVYMLAKLVQQIVGFVYLTYVSVYYFCIPQDLEGLHTDLSSEKLRNGSSVMHDALNARAFALLFAGFLTRAATNAGFAVTLSSVNDKRIRKFQQVLIRVLPAFCEYGIHSIGRLSLSSRVGKSSETSVFKITFGCSMLLPREYILGLYLGSKQQMPWQDLSKSDWRSHGHSPRGTPVA